MHRPPPVLAFLAPGHTHAVDGDIFLIVGTEVAQPKAEIHGESVVKPHTLTSRDAPAHQVALLAGGGQLVVKGTCLIHDSHVAALFIP